MCKILETASELALSTRNSLPPVPPASPLRRCLCLSAMFAEEVEDAVEELREGDGEINKCEIVKIFKSEMKRIRKILRNMCV